jgi:hypothetical protein
MRRRGGYLFLPGFSSLYDAIHGWMTGRMDGKSFTTTTSFTYIVIHVSMFLFLGEFLDVLATKENRGVNDTKDSVWNKWAQVATL